ncbi:MAG: pyruvate kinase [Rhodoferax sp.]|uniref:pyruvate kinase n=1 Tax=Rhodoferax sp. TaxID=50421 RepID=UPI001B531714|nr:pyruvate kinase [Rhodoferax sp.]MBP9904469.1 pyruvate kinase [Rhodoferax sp.]
MRKQKPVPKTLLTTAAPPTSSSPWIQGVCLKLIDQLWALRSAMLEREDELQQPLSQVLGQHRESARNLIHYLALRSVDLRELQNQLAWLGLSSLGRSESHVLASLDKVLGLLHRLTSQSWQDHSDEEPAGSVSSRARLTANTVNLLGQVPGNRPVRIMVTLPSEAAHDAAMVLDLAQAGMDIARINCAHDSAADWQLMTNHVRRAAQMVKRPIKILMDLGGPKIRTGDIAPQTPVLKLKPGKDQFGRVYRPARMQLRPIDQHDLLPGVDASVGVWEVWLSRLKVGSTLDFCDARGARRHLLVVRCDHQAVIVECLQTAYITPETVFTLVSDVKKKHTTLVCHIDRQPGVLHLQSGDSLRLTRDDMVHVTNDEDENSDEDPNGYSQVPCTLPQVIDQVKVGERIWFDDGRIGGVIRKTAPNWVEVEITQARPGGEKLGSDKGINLPDSQLDLPALSTKDIDDLTTVATLADMVGLSFVQKPADVTELREHLRRLGREDMGIVLKIETLQGFESLPDLMLSAMAANAAGVMIARGDLAVECGYERLAEVQEEILWCAEAAHMPVIWATQVLESLAKTGLPSRAEISDAGLGVRAECVMLNKGPFITDAIRTLDDILQRMGGHQTKKRPLLRALRAWGGFGSNAMLPP